MPTPAWFGWYHILWLLIISAECVVIYIFRKKISRKCANSILLIAGICLILLEMMKQIERSFSVGDGGALSWHYPPADFPFQFCSTPMYLLLLVGIIRKGKVYDVMLDYLATYALFAGGLVMIYPVGVYVESIFINIHTMIWHSSMFVAGFMILATRMVEFRIKTVLKATIIFAIILVMAILMNVFAHLIVPEEYFNMFYIGPYYPNNFPVLQDIYKAVPWAIFLIIYIVGFCAATMIVMSLAILSDKLESKVRNRKTAKKTN